MQILASALPGFRDLRAPLTAGYLWLLLLWIWLKPALATRPTNEIAASIYDLGKATGPIWVSVAVSVAAYLIGSISQSLSQPLPSGLKRFLKFGQKVRTDFQYQAIDNGRSGILAPVINSSQVRDMEKLQLAALAKLTPYLAANNKIDELKRAQRDVRLRAQEAERGLAFELNMPATLLVGKEHELFSEADRLKAESQLRFAISPPLLTLVAYVSFTESAWWLIAGIPVLVLALQGYFRETEFRSLMLAAVQRGVIKSQSVEEFRFWVSNLPLDGRSPVAERGSDSRSVDASERRSAR